MRKRGNLRVTIQLIKLAGKSNFLVLIGLLLGFISEATSIAMVGFGAIGVIKYLGFDIGLDYATIFIFVTCISMVRALLQFFEKYVDKYISTRYITKIRSQLFLKMESLAPAVLENKNFGDLITTLTTDVNNIEEFYAEILNPIGIAMMLAGSMCLYILLVHGLLLTIVAAFSFFVIGFIIPWVSQNAVKRQAFNYQNSLAEFNDYYLDSIRGCKDIIVARNENDRKKMIIEKGYKLSKSSQALNLRSSMINSITTGVAFLFIFIFIIVSALVIDIDGSELILTITIVCYYMTLKPAIRLNTLTSTYAKMIASGNRILDISEEKPLNPTITKGVDFEFESVEFNKVSFSYDGKTELLKRVNLNVKKGDIVAIIGQSGSGKSTLFKLLTQQYFPSSGELLFNGINVQDINTSAIYKNVSLFSQQTYIFQDSIRNNLLIAKPNATNREIMQACKKAHVHEAIVSLPRGYNTIIGEFSNSLSLGEKQRLGLARVYLTNPKLLLLDEPTSNVDSISEKIIMESLVENAKDMAIIIISHRASTVAYAKNIYKLKNGLIILEK